MRLVVLEWAAVGCRVAHGRGQTELELAAAEAVHDIDHLVERLAAPGSVTGELVDVTGVDARAAADTELARLLPHERRPVVARCIVGKRHVRAAVQRIAGRPYVALIRQARTHDRVARATASFAVFVD